MQQQTRLQGDTGGARANTHRGLQLRLRQDGPGELP